MNYTLNQLLKKAYSVAAILAVCCFFSLPLHAAEVESIEDSDIPPEVEDAIELKKESEFKIIPIVDITALGTYSKVSGSNDLGGANIKAILAPVMRLDKMNYIIPLYYGSYDRERQVVVEEEGGLVYNDLMDHNVTLEYKHIANEKTILKLDGLMRFHYTKEKDYKWGDGLYDYEDFGAGSSIEYFFIKEKREKSSLSIGGEYYLREYPNYKSLISLAAVTAPETDEKDYNGYRPTVTYKYINQGLNCAFLYSPVFKDFTDKKVVDLNGVLSNSKREDWFHYGQIDFTYLPENMPTSFRLALTGVVVDSNQNYYDSRNTVTLGDDVFTQNYYSFKSLDINPSITYIHKLEDKKAPATFTLGYAFLARDYDNRKAQNADGTYTDKTQLDKLHSLKLQVVYPLTDHISAIAMGKYTNATSNMRYQTYYSYEYESYYARAGIRIRY